MEEIVILENEAQEVFNEEVLEVSDIVVFDALKAYLKSIGNHPLLSAEEERSLSVLALAGDKAAQDRLVSCNLKLVVPIAKRYYGCGIPILDLIQEGNIGLIKAATKYDGTTGNRFSTYATYWVRQAISRALAEQSRTIRLPGNVIELLTKIKKATNEIVQKTHVQPTDKELADYLGVELEKVQTALDMSQAVGSLDVSVDDDGETSVGDLVEDRSAINPYQAMVAEANKEIVHSILDTLPPRESQILCLRFGINTKKPMTLEEVGKELGVSKERIRQIENKTIRKLRHPARAKMLREAMA